MYFMELILYPNGMIILLKRVIVNYIKDADRQHQVIYPDFQSRVERIGPYNGAV